MPSQWFYRRGSEEAGPVTFQDLMELVRAGTLKEDHRVRRELSQEWMAARDVIGLFRAAGAGTALPAPDAKTALPATPVAAAPAAEEPAPAPAAAEAAPAPAAPPRKAGPSPAARLVTAGVLAAVAIGAGFGLRWVAQNHARLLGKRDAFGEEFDGKFLDPARWVTYRGAVKVDPKDGQLVVSAKSVLGQESRGAIEALVGLEGDFDVRIDYRLVKFPTPREKDLKAELHLNGPDGPLAIIRGLNLPQGDWYCAWSDHTADSKKVVWKQKRTKDQGGSLGLKRTGRQLAFLTAAPGKELEAIETIHYGSSEIKTIAVSVWMPPTESPVEVAFDNFTIDADRIVRPTAQPRYAWLVSAAIVLAGLAIGAWWYQRPGRRARPRRRTGTGPAGSIPAS